MTIMHNINKSETRKGKNRSYETSTLVCRSVELGSQEFLGVLHTLNKHPSFSDALRFANTTFCALNLPGLYHFVQDFVRGYLTSFLPSFAPLTVTGPFCNDKKWKKPVPLYLYLKRYDDDKPGSKFCTSYCHDDFDCILFFSKASM